MDVVRLVDGKIAEHRKLFDQPALKQQSGLAKTA